MMNLNLMSESNVSVNVSSSRPLFVSTPNTQFSSAVCGEKRMQECQLENQQEINISPKEITEFSSDGQKLWLLISKIGKMEEEIRDLRSDVKTIVEKYLNPQITQRQLSDAKVHAPVSPYVLPGVSILLQSLDRIRLLFLIHHSFRNIEYHRPPYTLKMGVPSQSL